MLRILLATKDPSDDRAVQLGLAGLEIEWSVAKDPPALKESLSKSTYDVMILGLGPSPEDGLEELRVMRAYAPDTPLVMLVPPGSSPWRWRSPNRTWTSS
ncbi:MAG TPA: hypothetical protein VFS50_07695 [Meiothermus sp.]|nr:hypothetical protein [Meiothermus sp.]